MSPRRVLPCALALLLALATSCPRGAHAFGAEGCAQSVTCNGGVRTGKDATAIGYQTTASGGASTALGHSTTASGERSTAMGYYTHAEGFQSTATGWSTTASGTSSTAMGRDSTASGYCSAAMGSRTTASGDFSTAMGGDVEAQEDEALVNSGSIHGKNLGFVADARLTADVRKADPRTLLAAVAALRVVTHAPSANFCAHQNRTAADCAGARTVGLLAQDVARVMPGAVSAPASLTLARRPKGPRRSHGGDTGGHGKPRPAPPQVLEHVEGLQSLDVHVLIAQLVGAVQAQAQQIATQAKQIEQQDTRDARRAAQFASQAALIQAQTAQNAKQAKQIEQQAVRIEEHDARFEMLQHN